MKKITHVNATTVAGAVLALAKGKAAVIAGGTDLLDQLKAMISPILPDTLVNIKTISGLDYIKEEGGMLKIGTLTRLADIAESTVVQGKYAALAQAAHKVASPELRNMGTIGGNLCQDVRCWYYRAEHNHFYCFRKGGALCFGVAGDNRYLAILGGQVCFAVCPSDTAIALGALNATIVTNKRSIPTGDFFVVLGNILKDDEIVTEVQVPLPKAGTKQVFLKFAIRKAFDFAISSVATAITVAAGNVTDARIVLGGVCPYPYRATGAEDALKGKAISESVAAAAGTAAVKDAFALSKNAYNIQITKTLVKRAILACA